MLKILFLCLLLINGGLLAFQQGYLNDLFPSTREPARLKQQLNAEKLKVLPPADTAVASASAATAATPAEKVTLPASAVAAAPVVAACTEVGIFDEADAKKFETQLAALSLGDRLTRRPILEGTRHIVYIPPQGNKDGADKKAAELKKLGVEDFFVIQDNSPLQWGISLGVFKTEEAAKKHLAELAVKGVRSARVGAHGAATNKVAFQLRGLDAATQTSLQKIKEGYPRQDVHDCS
jgi:cell division protein FtsN